MRYRKFGSTGRQVSALSLGCMRFPDEESAFATVRRALEFGINYFETSRGYCGGQSEVWLGKAIAGDRRKVMLSTKSAPGQPDCLTADDVRRHIEESLAKLGTDAVDFYHAWMVNTRERYEACVRKGGWLDGVHRAMGEGLVRHVGITSHSTPEHVSEILDDGIFEVLTVQYSLILPGYREVVRKAQERGVGVVVMGPLGGGLLAQPSRALSHAFAPDSQVEGALKYVLCDPAISTAASGMTSPQEVETNCRLVDALPVGLSTGYQEGVDARLREALGEAVRDLEVAFCAGCRYCVSACPNGLRVFDVFSPHNLVLMGGRPERLGGLAARAAKMRDACTECRSCEEVCPQKLRIPEQLARVAETFAALASAD